MTSVLAVLAVCMPASTIDINSAARLPVSYTQDCECSCGNSGRINGVWLNYYSPCRCGDITIVLDELFPFPPLREDLPHTQLHPSVYAPSLNPGYGYFGSRRSFTLGNLIQNDLLDHRFLNWHLLDFHLLDHFDASFKFGARGFSDIDARGFSDIGYSLAPVASTTVPEPGTLALLAIGTVAIARRRKRAA